MYDSMDEVGDEMVTMQRVWKTQAEALSYANAASQNLTAQGYLVTQLSVSKTYGYNVKDDEESYTASVQGSKANKPEVAPVAVATDVPAGA